MIKKLTLTIDDDVIKQAKRYAETRETSLSRMVVNYFKRLTEGPSYHRDLIKKAPITLKLTGIAANSDITGKESTNATKKVWEVGDKIFAPTTLLKNVTEGSVSFNGSGILAHSTMSDVYTGSYSLNETTTNNPTTNSSSN